MTSHESYTVLSDQETWRSMRATMFYLSISAYFRKNNYPIRKLWLGL